MKHSRGFTLLELTVVVGIIMVISTGVVSVMIGYDGRARITREASDVKGVVAALRRYYQDVGAFPLQPAVAGNDPGLVTNVSSAANWNGPYLDRWPKGSPWLSTVTWKYERSGGAGYASGTDFNFNGTLGDELRLSLCSWTTPTDAATLAAIDTMYDDGVTTAPSGSALTTSGAMYWDSGNSCIRIYVGEGPSL